MKNLTKILTGVGITAATLLGAAIPATAATTPDTSSDRLIGQFMLDTKSNGNYVNNVQDAVLGQRATAVVGGPRTMWTIPALYEEGPIIHKKTGLCLTEGDWDEAAQQRYLVPQPCDGSYEQEFRLIGRALHLVKDTSRALGLSNENELTVKPVKSFVSQANLDFFIPHLAEETAPLTASIDSVDHANFSAIASGTGEPGATITITGPTGPLTTLVNENGDWSLEIPGLAAGENVLPVTQTTGTDVSDPIDLTVIIKPLETPIIDPLMAGGAGMLALAIMGGTLLRRKLSIR